MDGDANALITLLESMDLWKWLILGIVLLVIEMFTGSLFLLWPAIAAILVGVVKFLVAPLGWEMQLLLFAIITTAGLIWGEKYLRPRLNKNAANDDLNDRAKAMIGSRVQAVSDFKLGRGRVKVGDTEWAATIKDGDPLNGDELRITEVSGASVVVERL